VALKRVAHEDRLSVVEHLDELRSRLFVSVFVFVAAAVVCFWQNHLILDLLSEPLPRGQELITLGVTEPFFTTAKVVAYTALLLSMPVLLYELYAFVLPALSPTERRAALPLLLMVPVLFVSGVVFGYFLILPQALNFLTAFNADEFNIQLRASEYYGFAVLSLIAVGILFQIPVGVLAATRLGVTTPAQLRKNRRYAILAIAVAAMLLPGQDPFTMLLAMVPLLVLFELSIVVAAAFGRPSADVADRLASAEGS